MKKPVLFLVGPTASGKSSLAMEISQHLPVEIISADSMQVYRGMDIGTAKPSEEERSLIPHHLIDICDPSEEFSVYAFRKLALDAIADIVSRKKIPLVVGGTGLYVRGLLQGLFRQPEGHPEIRERLEREAATFEGLDSMYERLRSLDAQRAAKIKRGDQRRIVRALEIIEVSGKGPSSWSRDAEDLASLGYEPFVFGILRDRAELYRTIEKRVDEMFEKGLIDEVRKLSSEKLSKTAKQALGYKELLATFFAGENVTADLLASAKNQVKTRTRQFAKRQMTWFRREADIVWIAWDYQESTSVITAKVLQIYSDTLSRKHE